MTHDLTKDRVEAIAHWLWAPIGSVNYKWEDGTEGERDAYRHVARRYIAADPATAWLERVVEVLEKIKDMAPSFAVSNADKAGIDWQIHTSINTSTLRLVDALLTDISAARGS